MSESPVEHLDVLIVGAGLSGICAAHHLQHSSPWASYAIFEARDAIGGTWDLFRYPGIRSDSDMYTLGYSLRPWDGDKTIADGTSIREYIVDTAAETGIDRHIRFGHRIVSADWSSADGYWRITAQRTDSEELVHLTAGFYFACSGYYRYDHGHQPDFAGVDDFAGTLIHPQAWPQDLDYAGKRIVVIGSGATAITLVPALASTAGHVTMLQRSPSYVASVPESSPLAKALRKVLPGRLGGRLIRWILALMTQGTYRFSRRHPERVKAMVRRQLVKQLPEGYDIDTHFTPSYDPWDQRFCVVPDGDLFEAIGDDRATVVTDHVERFTETGIALRSGAHLDADIVVSATGLEMLFGGGVDLRVDGTEVDPHERLTYKGMMLEDVPNLALAFGYTNASWTLKADLIAGYVCRLLNHMRETGTVQCTPRNEGAAVTAEPLLGLSAGYIQRAADQFPLQGAADPWRVHQSYLRDRRTMKRGPVDDGTMQFTRPSAGSPAPGPADRRTETHDETHPEDVLT